MGAPFTRILDPASLRPDLSLTVTANEDERAAIAAFLDLLGLDALSADLTAHRSPKGEIRIDGQIRAALSQRCVVSLEPVPQSLEEEVHLRFVPADEGRGEASAEEVISAEGEDPPDPYPPSGIDVGAVIVEQLALNLDPYPRAPGVKLEEQMEVQEDKPDSPFAVLKSLGHRDG